MSTKELKKSEVWAYFESVKGNEKKATCKLCFDTYSYATSITNLKKHLHHKHREVCPPEILTEPKKKYRFGFTLGPLLKYYTVIDEEQKLVRCNACNEAKSFANSEMELKSHLFRVHPELHFKLVKKKRPKYKLKEVSVTSSDNDGK